MIQYIPILKWKPAEQGALMRLESAERLPMLPIIEILPLDANLAPKELVTATLVKFVAVAIKSSLGLFSNGFGLDGRYLFASGISIKRLARICGDLRKESLNAIPVVEPDRVLTETIDLSLLKPLRAVILRVPVRVTPLVETLQALTDLRNAIGKRADVIAVLDMDGFGDADNSMFMKLVDPMIKAVMSAGTANRVSLAGGSFPASLSRYKQGRSEISRREWAIWSHFQKQPGLSGLIFSDYAVTNPKLLIIPKGTPIPVLAQIRYAVTDRWVLQRGAVIKGSAGFQQYKQLCVVMMASPEYCGEPYSYGDKMIKHHSDPSPKVTTGSPQTWRRDATNHHLVHTIRQLTT